MSQAKIIEKYGIDYPKTGSPGFHGKLIYGTGKHKPTEREHKHHPIVLGFTLRSEPGKLSGNVSYNRITEEEWVHDPADYSISHKIDTVDYEVYLDGHRIATAPAGKTKAQKEKFCKAVVYALVYDETSLKDKLAEIGYDPMVTIMNMIRSVKIIPGPRSIYGWCKIGSHLSIIEEAIV